MLVPEYSKSLPTCPQFLSVLQAAVTTVSQPRPVLPLGHVWELFFLRKRHYFF